jgi:hypothetical protein
VGRVIKGGMDASKLRTKDSVGLTRASGGDQIGGSSRSIVKGGTKNVGPGRLRDARAVSIVSDKGGRISEGAVREDRSGTNKREKADTRRGRRMHGG